MLHSKPEPAPSLPGEGWTAEFKPTTEALAASVLAENEPDEAGSILAIWEEVFDLRLDREKVTGHLEALRQWQRRWSEK
ncbi:MAG: hypothetical protein HYV04_19330 [Deltaproteobacteria bacterium]|nr:hypothetical protein [Deltaproteobacteria bacterium]